MSYSKYKTCSWSGVHNTRCVLYWFLRKSYSQPLKLMSQTWLMNTLLWFFDWCFFKETFFFENEANLIYVLWTLVYCWCYQLMQWLYLHRTCWKYWLCRVTSVIWLIELFLCHYFGKASYIFSLLLYVGFQCQKIVSGKKPTIWLSDPAFGCIVKYKKSDSDFVQLCFLLFNPDYIGFFFK